jgi:hypothetical protein
MDEVSEYDVGDNGTVWSLFSSSLNPVIVELGLNIQN